MEPVKVINKDQMVRLVKDTVETMGFSTVETKVVQNKGGKTLKIIIFKPEGGVSMDDCSRVSNVVLRRLELDNPDFSESYDMLVESPGVDRMLESPDELTIFKNKEIRFVLRNASAYGLKDNVVIGTAEITGGSAATDDVKLRIKSGDKTLDVPWKDVSQAKLYFDIKKYL